MICFGTRGARRIGLHHFQRIGRATVYGRDLLHIAVCAYCDGARIDKGRA
jgi:hypothetical protein